MLLQGPVYLDRGVAEGGVREHMHTHTHHRLVLH